MKRTVILAILSILTACTSAPYRTGSIAIDKFSISDYKTNNIIDIKPDVAERFRDMLHKELLGEINKESKLKVADNCATADYELVGRFEKIDTEIDSHWRLVTITVSREHDVEIEASLRDCKTSKPILEFSKSKSDSDTSNIISSLASKIVDQIKKDPSKIPPTP